MNLITAQFIRLKTWVRQCTFYNYNCTIIKICWFNQVFTRINKFEIVLISYHLPPIFFMKRQYVIVKSLFNRRNR